MRCHLYTKIDVRGMSRAWQQRRMCGTIIFWLLDQWLIPISANWPKEMVMAAGYKSVINLLGPPLSPVHYRLLSVLYSTHLLLQRVCKYDGIMRFGKLPIIAYQSSSPRLVAGHYGAMRSKRFWTWLGRCRPTWQIIIIAFFPVPCPHCRRCRFSPFFDGHCRTHIAPRS